MDSYTHTQTFIVVSFYKVIILMALDFYNACIFRADTKALELYVTGYKNLIW